MIKILKMYKDVITPSRAHDYDSGLDLHVYLKNHESMIYQERDYLFPGETKLFQTGLKVEIPMGQEGQIRSRSGLAKKGLVVANSPGTIDSGYRGEVCILLHNNSRETQFIEDGDRIAQLVVCPVELPRVEIVEALEDSPRGAAGFGSTGMK